MGEKYGVAWINLLYDLDTEVRITNPSEEVKKVSNIKPTKYLIIPYISKIFPNDFNLEAENINWRPKRIIEPPEEGGHYPVIKRTELEDAKVGSSYKVTLMHCVVDIDRDLEKLGIPRIDSVNTTIFNAGKLENLLASSKETFLKFLRSKELISAEKEIYFELSSVNRYFDY